MSRWSLSIAALAALTLGGIRADAAPSKAECVAAHELGQRMWKADKLRKALYYLNQCAAEECPAVLATECAAWRAQASSELPTVTIRALGPDGEPIALRNVVIDGELVQDPASHAVDPGQHTLIATTLDGHSVSTIFSASRGERSSPIVLRISAPPAPTRTAPAPPQAAPLPATTTPVIKYVPMSTRVSPSASPYAWGFAATGAAALAAFTWFGLSGRAKERELDRDCAPFCAQSEVDSMHRDYVIADVSLGIGLAAFAASVWIIHAYREPSTPSRTAVFDARGLRLEF